MTKPLDRTAHVALDYALGTALLTAPLLLGLSTRARTFFGAFGAVTATVNALTDSRLGVRRLIPFRTHRAIDLAADPLYLALPLLTGIAKEPRARALWLGSAALLGAAVLLTDWDAPADS
jgi:hypothetical protein